MHEDLTHLKYLLIEIESDITACNIMSANAKLNDKVPLRIKIISMGNAEVGKSCIIKRYCEKRFVNKYLTTIGIDYGVTKVTLQERDIKVNIFDMAGHPLFYEVRNEFYKDTQGAILVYDISDRGSFTSLDRWLEELNSEINNKTEVDSIVVCVCGNKTDLKRQVDESEGQLWADSHGFHFFETSALTGEGVNELFQVLFEGVVRTCENGGKREPIAIQLGYTKEQIEAIQRLKNAKNDYERLGLYPGASKDDVNKAYRKLAVLLHPDKSIAPGSEDAFKLLVTARTALLKRC
ncbi:dnaJ homolog subfamily C member 27-like [Biomphalaria glabrata]|uniref:DnaJ homolog subfamily C member 27-like n=1 Tax=Biomphalaria glabrata TaxID=6526 RepID=A0A9W2Z9A6_BIOGL|nr:dnaJ homolog subfamily C member 27-like [Biomphalaria glabrata]XP_055871558.1 dnaJ homolog subfamily C member 27-like [Biomphalaria glabrata]XP_055871559.1 dnaJ homolog subfamily C member 27-like [Biomphalaria glabrata]XP_055871560.1 dnaJ homolog subfamily C member 27-like [Biomphalaria glabrata]